MSEFTITLGKASALTSDEQQARVRRAREVLDGAGWLFNEFMSEANRELLDTAPERSDLREELYREIKVAAGLKAKLIRIIETQQAKDTVHERRDRTE